MNNRIVKASALEDILERMKGCTALIYVLCEVTECSSIPGNVLRSVGDLLGTIAQDFEADVKAAAVCNGEVIQG